MSEKLSKNDSTLDMVKKAIECVKNIERDNGLSDEEIIIRFTSGNCGFLAADIKVLIEIFCEKENIPKRQISLYQADTCAGPHVYLKIPDPNYKAEKSAGFNKKYLYIDITGVYTQEEMKERNSDTAFIEANEKVNSGKVRECVISHERLDDTSNKLFKALLPSEKEFNKEIE